MTALYHCFTTPLNIYIKSQDSSLTIWLELQKFLSLHPLSLCVSPLYLLPSSWLLLSRGTRAVSARTSPSLTVAHLHNQPTPGTTWHGITQHTSHTRPHQATPGHQQLSHCQHCNTDQDHPGGVRAFSRGDLQRDPWEEFLPDLCWESSSKPCKTLFCGEYKIL